MVVPVVGSRVAARREGKGEVRVVRANKAVGAKVVAAVSRVVAAASRVVARGVVDKGDRVVEEVRAEVARGSDRVAGRAGHSEREGGSGGGQR